MALPPTAPGPKAGEPRLLDGPTILRNQKMGRRVVIAPHSQDYAVRLVMATHPQGELATPMVNQFLRFGASPRAAQAMELAGKVWALLDGRANVSIDDLRTAVLPAMRHRCLLNFEGEAEVKTTDEIIQNIVETLPADVGVPAA